MHGRWINTAPAISVKINAYRDLLNAAAVRQSPR